MRLFSRLAIVLIFLSMSFPPGSFCQAADAAEKPVGRVVDKVVARVASEPITQREIDILLKDAPNLTRGEALKVLIERKLVLSWARDNGISASPKEVETAEKSVLDNNQMSKDHLEEYLASIGQDYRDFEDNLKEQIILRKSLSAAVGARVTVTEEELKERYAKDYPLTDIFSLRHILIKPGLAQLDSDTAARDLALDIMDQIRAGVPFETLVKQYSADEATASRGGFLGTFRKGELLPELESLALTLEPGEVGGPVGTSLGLHILKLETRSTSDPPPFSAVEEQIRSTLTAEKNQEAQDLWFRELKERADIEIFTNGG